MASRRLGLGELLTAASGAALLVAMFALNWFSFVDAAQQHSLKRFGVTEGTVPSVHADGWAALPAPRWALLATCALCAASVVSALRASPRIAGRVDLVLLVVAVTSAVLILFRVLDPPGPNELATVEVGTFVGLAATLGAAGGAYLTIRGLGTSLRGIWRDLEDEAPGSPSRPQAGAASAAPPAPDPSAPHSVPPPSARPRDPSDPG
jgi:hypothetical protein